MVCSGVSARAAIVHDYLSQVTEVPAVGPHGEVVPIPGGFTGVNSLAADAGNVWLAEQGSNGSRLDEFSASSGAFVSQLPQVSGVSHLNLGVAVGHTAGEAHVYVPGYEPASEASVVLVFGASGGGLLGKWTGAVAKTPGKVFGCLACGGQRQEALVSVDNSSSLGDWAAGDVYVADPQNNVVDVIEPAGANEGKLAGELTGVSPTEPFSKVEDVAVSAFNGDVLVVDGEAVDMFKPAAIAGQYEFVGVLPGPPPDGTSIGIYSVAVDGVDGDIYVSELTNTGGEIKTVVSEFDSAGVYLAQITGAGTPGGAFQFVKSLAVDSSTHRVFVGDLRGFSNEKGGEVHVGAVDTFSPNLVVPDVTNGPVSGLQPESVTLTGAVNPDKAGVATCQFDYGTSPSFGQVAPCSSSVPDGVSAVPVQATVTGLQPDTTYYYRLQATNDNGTNPGEVSQDREFTTRGPGVREESVSNVASGSVTFDATIDPHGTLTSYYFQYGPTAAYGSDVPTVPGAGIGSGEGSVEVSQHVQNGLSTATTYHYRVVAVSEIEAGRIEAFVGPDKTFTTQSAGGGGGSVLADGRSWELVTPPDKSGAQIYAIGQYSGEGGVIQASASGGALTWVSDDPTEAEPQGYTNLLQGFSARGAEGWVSRNIAIPHPGATGVSIGEGSEYRFFSEDLSRGVVQPFGKFVPSLSKEASEPTAYLSSEYEGGDTGDSCSVSCFRPLVTGAPGFANVPAGTVFGEEATVVGTTSECVFLCGPQFVGATPDLSHVVLKSTSGSLTPTPDPYRGLYEWSAGKLVLVSVLPGPNGGATGGELGVGLNARHAISDDGSRIFWTHSSDLFMRDVLRGETLLIGENVEFEDATPDGSIVLFSGKMCEISQNGTSGELECSTTSLSGKIVGTSSDGSWVYFVSPEVLASGAVVGGHNLYVRHAGATRFIASVSGEDTARLAVTDKDLTQLVSRVSPDGRWLAFMSQSSLAGANTRDAVTGVPDEEVYLYDAEANGGAGRLVCASCNPSGARPVGVEYGAQEDTLWGGDRVWNAVRGPTIASNIPGWTPYKVHAGLYQPRSLSNSGRLFFNSDDGLVPQDVNGTWDVYEYESPGVGDCTSVKATFSERSDGCVGLVSSGGSGEESGFLDASATGGDVFFLTSAKLAGQDFDSALDVYDAHECSSDAPCFTSSPVSPPVCDTGDACKAAPTPQPALFGSPSSATFSGAGNVTSASSKPAVAPKGLTRAQKLARALKACRKKGKRRAVCVRQARARYASRTRRVNASKRGGR
jgi:hypothetical protein